MKINCRNSEKVNNNLHIHRFNQTHLLCNFFVFNKELLKFEKSAYAIRQKIYYNIIDINRFCNGLYDVNGSVQFFFGVKASNIRCKADYCTFKKKIRPFIIFLSDICMKCPSRNKM